MSIDNQSDKVFKALASPEEEWQWAIEGLKEVYAHCQKEGVRMALEPLNRFETNFLNRHDQALLLAEQIAPDVGVCLDVYHMNQEDANMFKAIRNAGPKLYDLHVADNNRFPPGGGSWDWKKLISTLKQAGYDKQLTVEFVVPMDRSPLAKKMEEAGTTATEAELKFIRDHGSDLMSDAEYTQHVEASIKTLRAAGA